MSELQGLIEQTYEAAKAGRWNQVLSEWSASNVLARRCSRYARAGSGWGFLHQAAHFGNDAACRMLIGLGAAADQPARDAQTPGDVAERNGHAALAAFLRATATGLDTPWAPPVDPDVLPASNRWQESIEARADTDRFAAYCGRLVRIPRGTTHFTDSLGRILVGWHGTFDPPRGMDGESLIAARTIPRE